jgi:tRNA-Thr(GGU) m(6)t(6)A37 methyltransferase TsaA
MKNSIEYHLNPIGEVIANEGAGVFQIQLYPLYRDGLKMLAAFSHVIVCWWAHGHDNPASRALLTTQLPYAPGVEAGVFACRSEYRPNPICITTMPILNLDQESGMVTLPWIDAHDGSPVIDLKPYIPVSDRIRDVRVADWMQEWPQWMEEAGAYFAEHPVDFGE